MSTVSFPPPGAPFAPPAPAAAAGPPPPQPLDRRQLDSRRVAARLIDGLIAGAPALFVALGVGRTLEIFLVSFTLAYFFLCESLFGQTVGKRAMGLRVLMRDGRAATASAVSARTVLRLIDDGPIGLVVMVASGRRRQRLGDLLGGTIVARATPKVPPAPLSPMILVYPVAWSIGAIALAITTQGGSDYKAAVDGVCASRNAAIAAVGPQGPDVRVLSRWIHEDRARIAALPAPAGSENLRAEVLALDADVDRALSDAIARASASADPRGAFQAQLPQLLDLQQRRRARYAELGMPACAGQRS